MRRRSFGVVLSCDPVYRALVQDARKNPALLGVVSDYREDQGFPRLASREGRLAKKETVRPASEVAAPPTPEEEKKQAREADLRQRVLAVGERYHDWVAALYQSRRAYVEYGSGGQEMLDWEAYGKRGYRNPHTGNKVPAKWRNAGARIVGEGRKARIVLENYRGKVVARLRIPKKDWEKWTRQEFVAWVQEQCHAGTS